MSNRDRHDLHITNLSVMWTIESLFTAHKEATGEYKDALAIILNQAVMNELNEGKFDVDLAVETFPSFEDKITELKFLLNHAPHDRTARQAVINKIDAFLLPKIAELSDDDSIEPLSQLAPHESKSYEAINEISHARCEKRHTELSNRDASQIGGIVV
ncbi:MAG: hypothetical protein WCP11_02715 [Candidatus Saccharibacteria bacterium]